MQLHIQASRAIQRSTKAAFVKGDDPKQWLETFQQWGIPYAQLECYAVPVSLQSLELAGLFVVFHQIPKGTIKYPYGSVGDQLFLPVDAVLMPQVAEKELKELLLYKRQLMHPVYGLVGFHPSDRLDLTQLITYQNEQGENWSLAKPGPLAHRPLLSIKLDEPPLSDFILRLENDMGKKDLKDIPKTDGRNKEDSGDWLNKLGRDFLKKSSEASRKLGDSLFGGTDGENTPAWFKQLDQWTQNRLNELEQRRNAEMKRLLNLFDKDPDEALRYSIPLDNPYQGRGGGDGFTSKLLRRALDFDIGRIGGGRSDYWAIDEYYYDLRRKYEQAAQKKLSEGDYRQAAYIYAHLLGNFHAAANALKQGKFYREAAILYRDHLNNKVEAAQCLEKGGLYLEAITLYKELEKHEKIGDLYLHLEQVKKANQHFEICVEEYLEKGNTLEAGRVLLEKMNEMGRAKELYLQAWKRNEQAEASIIRFFDLVAKTESTDTLVHQVRYIKQLEKSTARYDQLLRVYVHLKKKHHEPEIQQALQDLAYEILSQQVKIQKYNKLPLLNQFIADDPLLLIDTKRFRSLKQKKLERTPYIEPFKKAAQFDLRKGVNWESICSFNNQLLILGKDRSTLHLGRANQAGNVEYYTWNNQELVDSPVSFMEIPDGGNVMGLVGPVIPESIPAVLPANAGFSEETIVLNPARFKQNHSAMTIGKDGMIACISWNGNSLLLDHFNRIGELKKSDYCEPAGNQLIPLGLFLPTNQLIYRNETYFFPGNQGIYSTDADGHLRYEDLGSEIKRILVSPFHVPTTLAILTQMGMLIAQYTEEGWQNIGDVFVPPMLSDFCFTNQGLLTLSLYGDEAMLYTVDKVQKFKARFKLEETCIKVVPDIRRDEVAFLTENKRVLRYKLG